MAIWELVLMFKTVFQCVIAFAVRIGEKKICSMNSIDEITQS